MIETSLKLTDVGLIPVDWQCMPISSLSEIITGGTPSTGVAAYWGGNIRWMNSGELNLKFITEVEGRITNVGLENSSTHLIPEYCVLIGLAGQGKTRGTAAYNLIPLCTNQSIAAILPNDSFCPLYLYYFIDSLYLLLRSLSAGDGGRGGLNKKIIGNLKVAIPDSLDEQRAIAEALSDIDKLIAALDKKIEKQKMIKQGVMQELLTGKRRLEGFSEPWVEMTFEDLFSVVPVRGHQVDTSEYKCFGKYPIIDQGQNDIVGYTNCDNPLGCPPKGLIIFGDHTRVFKVAFSDFYVGADGVKVLESKFNNSLFLYYYCTTLNIPNTGYNRHMKYLKASHFLLPISLDEQNAIAECISSIDNDIRDLGKLKAKYTYLKQGMMQQLLTGKIRLIDSLTI